MYYQIIYSSYPEYANCEIVGIPSKYDFKPYAYGFQQDSPLLGPFNFYLKQFRETGGIKKIQERYEAGDQVGCFENCDQM